MADRPIIFSAPMVRALLDGRKTQTRRVLKPQPELNEAGLWRYPPDSACVGGPKKWVKRFGGFCQTDAEGLKDFLTPIGTRTFLPYAIGDRLYVREAHALVPSSAYRMSEGVPYAVNQDDPDRACVYREGWERSSPGTGWRPSIHMPRWASRLTLTVTDVRVHRLADDIMLGDCWAEGCMTGRDLYGADAIPKGADLPFEEFRDLWNSIHGPDAWATNPWVVALTFTVARENIDRVPG
jgi:hypothetical protein